MARGSKHPPKKKYVNKARQAPVIEHSDSEREFSANEAEQKAAIHLREAISIAEWGNAPNAALHSAYYSMHFCAVAAIYRSGGVGKRKDVPESHEHVIQHYIVLAESLDDEFLKTSGTLLNRARDDRMRADYFVGADQGRNFGLQGASREEASEAAEVAARFLKAWTDKWTDVYPHRILRPVPR
jgi:hypothetical protein